MSNINRFQVRYNDRMEDFSPIFTADTTGEIYDWFQEKPLRRDADVRIADLIDDISVDSEEFLEAFDDRECPGDLQFF